MPEHITLDTALAEAEYALDKALREFVHDCDDDRLLIDAREDIRAVRMRHNPALPPWP